MKKIPEPPVMSNERLLHIANVFVEDLQATVDRLTDEVREAKEELDRVKTRTSQQIGNYVIITSTIKIMLNLVSGESGPVDLTTLSDEVASVVAELIDARKKLDEIRCIVAPPTSQPDDSDCCVPPE